MPVIGAGPVPFPAWPQGWAEAPPEATHRAALLEELRWDAWQLLRTYCSAEQWEQMLRTGWLPVQGSRGGSYFIDPSAEAVVERDPNLPGALPMPPGVMVHWCIHALDGSPEDRILALLLLLRTDEARFRAIGNASLRSDDYMRTRRLSGYSRFDYYPVPPPPVPFPPPDPATYNLGRPIQPGPYPPQGVRPPD